jgi:protocatechuate 4,5-dioxygenase alpha chain
MALSKPYLGIPGTTVFDAEMARRGYQLNQFCRSLMKPENREQFHADARAYLERWTLSNDQRVAVLERDFNRCIELGANIYCLLIYGASLGLDEVDMACQMAGMPREQYLKMMREGGRRPEDLEAMTGNP